MGFDMLRFVEISVPDTKVASSTNNKNYFYDIFFTFIDRCAAVSKSNFKVIKSFTSYVSLT